MNTIAHLNINETSVLTNCQVIDMQWPNRAISWPSLKTHPETLGQITTEHVDIFTSVSRDVLIHFPTNQVHARSFLFIFHSVALPGSIFDVTEADPFLDCLISSTQGAAVKFLVDIQQPIINDSFPLKHERIFFHRRLAVTSNSRISSCQKYQYNQQSSAG